MVLLAIDERLLDDHFVAVRGVVAALVGLTQASVLKFKRHDSLAGRP